MAVPTRKKVPWAGWHKKAPFGKQRTEMYKRCGKKCFLGSKTPDDKSHPDFPICNKGTCKINPKGVYSAYIRSKEWGNKKSTYKGKGHPRLKKNNYKTIGNKAKKILKKFGIKIGK